MMCCFVTILMMYGSGRSGCHCGLIMMIRYGLHHLYEVCCSTIVSRQTGSGAPECTTLLCLQGSDTEKRKRPGQMQLAVQMTLQTRPYGTGSLERTKIRIICNGVCSEELGMS